MGALRHPINQYQAGRPWGICQRCAFQLRLDELKTEWTGLLVCSDCYDPRPVELDPPNVYAEGLPLINASPDPGDILGPNLTTPNDL